MSKLRNIFGKSPQKASQDLSNVSEQLDKMEIENGREKEVTEAKSARRGPRNGARRIRVDSDDLEELVASHKAKDEQVEDLLKKLVEGLVRRLKEEVEES
jgi:(2Fe-2S) ferredoxin